MLVKWTMKAKHILSATIPFALCNSLCTVAFCTDTSPPVTLHHQQRPITHQTTRQQELRSSMMASESITTDNVRQCTKTTKTVYLIRHAESLENVAYKGARRLQAAYTSRKLPQPYDVVDAFQLMFKMFRPSVTNAALSDFGRHQVEQLHGNLVRDKFWEPLRQDAVIVHSPLQRAKQTAYGALWGPQHMDDAGPPGNENVFELSSLKEVNPAEIIIDALTPWARQKTVDYRIHDLEEWIQSRPEDTIVLVGHSVYFKRMLNLPKTFDNCDVWQAKYQTNGEASKEQGELPRSWVSVNRMYGLKPEQIPVVEEEQ